MQLRDVSLEITHICVVEIVNLLANFNTTGGIYRLQYVHRAAHHESRKSCPERELSLQRSRDNGHARKQRFEDTNLFSLGSNDIGHII